MPLSSTRPRVAHYSRPGSRREVEDGAIGASVEVGGTDRVSYLDLMREYAKQRSLSRRFIPVPVLTPWLSSKWLGFVTPVYARVGRKLIDSLRNETVVTSSQSELFDGAPVQAR